MPDATPLSIIQQNSPFHMHHVGTSHFCKMWVSSSRANVDHKFMCRLTSTIQHPLQWCNTYNITLEQHINQYAYIWKIRTEGKRDRGRDSARTKLQGIVQNRIGTSLFITVTTRTYRSGHQLCDSVRKASQTCQPHTSFTTPQLLRS
jgi:hypothetical protein